MDMEKLNKWMVGIDGRNSSEAVLWNIVDLANHFKPESITFICVFQELDLPNEIWSKFPDLQTTQMQDFGHKLSESVSGVLDDSIEYTIELNVGNPLTELSKKSQQPEFDLILIGNDKNHYKLRDRVIKKSSCSVLLVPDQKIDKLQNILMPIDHYDYSQRIASVARQFVDCYQVEKVKALHIYQDAFHYLNLILESPYEVEEILQKRKELDDQLQSYALYKTKEFAENHKFPGFEGEIIKMGKGVNIDKPLAKSTTNYKPDLIIIESKGKAASSAYLLGNMTESSENGLVQSYLYIVKAKREPVGVLKSLLRLDYRAVTNLIYS